MDKHIFISIYIYIYIHVCRVKRPTRQHLLPLFFFADVWRCPPKGALPSEKSSDKGDARPNVSGARENLLGNLAVVTKKQMTLGLVYYIGNYVQTITACTILCCEDDGLSTCLYVKKGANNGIDIGDARLFLGKISLSSNFSMFFLHVARPWLVLRRLLARI